MTFGTGLALIALAVATVLIMDWVVRGWRQLLAEQTQADNQRIGAAQVRDSEAPTHITE